MEGNSQSSPEQPVRIVNELWAVSARQSDLGRAFARRMQMHPTDSAAIVEIIRAEDRGQPLTPARLSERIGLTSGATSILLNRLEAAGHITRERGHADRRLVTLHSSANVHSDGDEFFAPLRDRLTAMMNGYTPEQLAVVEEFIGEFGRTVEEYILATPAVSA